MLLEDWLRREGLSFAEAGRRLGLRSRASVGRIIRERLAGPDTVRGIYDLTGGEVSPNDIFDLHPQGGHATEAAE